MKEKTFYDKIHTLGRLTVILALLCFVSIPFALTIIYDIPMDVVQSLKCGMPILITFSITGICENLSFMPIIGSGALYMACVTGNVSNMKIPAAVNAMEIAGHAPGSEKGDVISMIAVASSTIVTTIIVFMGMKFLAPLFAPVYNNSFLKPAFQNMVPALFGALLLPYILKAPKQSAVPIILPVVLIFVLGRSFFSSNQSYIMVGVIIVSAIYSYLLYKKGKL